MEDLFVREASNPLITPEHLNLQASAVLNPGAALVDGEVVLLLRIEDRTGISHIRVARSHNGVDSWRIADRPLLEPDLPDFPFEEWGCEDARVTQIGPDRWVIAYTAYSRYGPAVALATTEDFDTVNRLGVVLAPSNKDATVLPGTFDGQRILLHRPVTGGQEHVWYACAPDNGDLVHWSLPGVLLPETGGPWWDSLRVGVGAPPLETEQGWLLIYHGVKEMGDRPVYRLGLALLDHDNPRKVLARAQEWVMSPETRYEQHGLVPNVVYTCGAVEHEEDVWLYYGAADTVVGLARARKSALLTFVLENDYLRKVKPAKGTVV